MTQFVYGKNVVAQLLDDGAKIHEVWLMQGFRDQKAGAPRAGGEDPGEMGEPGPSWMPR